MLNDEVNLLLIRILRRLSNFDRRALFWLNLSKIKLSGLPNNFGWCQLLVGEETRPTVNTGSAL